MNKLNFHISEYKSSFGTPEQLPQSVLPEIAFAGRSNVGKSSLLNKLMFSKKLAKVSSKPGKTATINFYEVGKDVGWEHADLEGSFASEADDEGAAFEDAYLESSPSQGTSNENESGSENGLVEIGPVHLVDLPGYGYAQVSKAEKERWARLIGGYFDDDRNFVLIVSLIDIRHDPSALDQSMVSFLQENDFPFAIALTKADKLSRQKANQQKQRIRKALNLPKDIPMIVTSAETGAGIEELQSLITQSCS